MVDPEKVRREIAAEKMCLTSNSHKGTYEKGAVARIEGRPLSDCPHRGYNAFAAVHAKYWRMGWESADRKMGGRRPTETGRR